MAATGEAAGAVRVVAKAAVVRAAATAAGMARAVKGGRC